MIFSKLKLAFLRPNENPTFKTGLLKQYYQRQGYGFIYLKSTGQEVFVHHTDLKDKVKEGDQVTFELDFTPLGCKARKVQLANA